ncbi:hypothetical protein ACQPXM_29445 [Kribbella sp. CA-253562]|uniref:hypothetical protein n=1 Tax=Kribbella sp. CA-253562 TaxID=3239942 RepID=UPI003D9035FD
MKGVFFVSRTSTLYAQIEDVLLRAGAVAGTDDVVQIRDDRGRLFTVYGRLDAAFEQDLFEPPVAVHGVDPPDPRSASACWVECRWPDLLVSWVQRLATEIGSPLWVLDGDGVFWSDEQLDAEAVRL